MRLLTIFKDPAEAHLLGAFLQQQGIDHKIEGQINRTWDSPDYGTIETAVWVVNEEQWQEAEEWTHHFLADSRISFLQTSALPATPTLQTNSPSPSCPMGWATRLLLLTMVVLFLALQFTTVSSQPGIPTLFNSPVEKALLYDYPDAFALIDTLIQRYGYSTLQNPEKLPPEGQRLLQKLEDSPPWQGIYGLLSHEKPAHSSPLFQKIREGQVWRLVSPILLHGDMFHLFFNMLWFIVLGKQIEQKLGAARYLLFIGLTAIFANTAQYLMSGPNFIGFSGVICGMLAFIWARQRRMPSEGYHLERATAAFMLVFVLGMAAWQMLSFFLESSLDTSISVNLANTAHIAGGMGGLFLSQLHFFKAHHDS